MKLLFINPNSTTSMTDKISRAARHAAEPIQGLDVYARTSVSGPPAIQGPDDGEQAVPGLLEEIQRGIEDEMDAFAIACFDDTGLDQARAISDRPVIGICQAACHAAALQQQHFTIVTTLAISLPVIETNIVSYGMQAWCRRVRASDVPVLALEAPGSEAEERVSATIAEALREDQIEAIVLGCAGMTDLVERLQQRHGVPVIDGVAAAVALAPALVRLSETPQRAP